MTIEKEMELLVDSHHGIYIPKMFMLQNKMHFTDEQIESLMNPYNELYWDVWIEFVDSFSVKDADGETWYIVEDGDLWLVPESKMNEDLFN